MSNLSFESIFRSFFPLQGVPELLGSRVIAQPSGGPALPMYFRYNVGVEQWPSVKFNI